MHRLRNALREHRHVLIVVTLLTLVTTFPTILYVFKADVFWHPAGTSHDVYIKMWDVWYGKQFLTGQVDPFHTNLMFYPEGTSLALHPFFIPHIVVVNLLALVIPVSNAFSLTYMLIIALCALAAYAYLAWLFSDKWIALFGAVVFGLSPHVVGHPNHPDIAFIATIPLALYCFHRGTNERRPFLAALAGLLTGLTTVVTLYGYICLLITLGFFVLALARARLREKQFWLNVALLIVTILLASSWRIFALVNYSDSLSEMATWHGTDEVRTDAISYLVNHQNPLLGRPIEAILRTPENAHISPTSYLGYATLLLVGIGMLTPVTRRMMAPWAFLCALFLILRMGSRLAVNGTVYADIPLPKYYLNQLLPQMFASFWEADNLMMGALLPLAVLACYGLVALRKRYASLARPAVILALIAIVALEYHIPVQTDRIFPLGDGTISAERLAFLNWLDQEDGDIRLINLPMGRSQSKIYNFYQSLSGFPHAEGAISRTPDRAFDYIRANLLLNAWHQQQPVGCEWVDRDDYLGGLAQLQEDGFSHVVYHSEFEDLGAVRESFRDVIPAFENEFVWIFRLSDLREICTDAQRAHFALTQAYADALQKRSIPHERHGILLVFPPTNRARDNLLRYFQQFAQIDSAVASITTNDKGQVQIRRLQSSAAIPRSDLEQFAALRTVNLGQEHDAEQTPAFQGWFRERFHFCQRFFEDERASIDAYLRVDIPCSALDQSSALEVQYDSGVRLHNASFDLEGDTLRFYMAWTDEAAGKTSFSLQFFDDKGHKALQYDSVIHRQLLSTHEIDASSLPAGAYLIQLIVYDSETRASQGGTISETGQRFAREVELANIEIGP